MRSNRRSFLKLLPSAAVAATVVPGSVGSAIAAAVPLAAGAVLFKDEEDLIFRREPDIHRFPFFCTQTYMGGGPGTALPTSIWFASEAELLAHIEYHVLPWMDEIAAEGGYYEGSQCPSELITPVVERVRREEVPFALGVLDINHATRVVDRHGGYMWGWTAVEEIRTSPDWEDHRWELGERLGVELPDPITDAQLQAVCEEIHRVNRDY